MNRKIKKRLGNRAPLPLGSREQSTEERSLGTGIIKDDSSEARKREAAEPLYILRYE